MGVKLLLSDGDFDILEKETGEDFSMMRKRVAEGKCRAVRFSTLEFYCRLLNRQPGEVLELVDDGWKLSDYLGSPNEPEEPSDRRAYAVVAVVVAVVALAFVLSITLRFG